jgi:hypothetical protein
VFTARYALSPYIKQMSFVLKGLNYQYTTNHNTFCVISGFRREADEICALLGYYAASNGNPLPTFRDKLSVPSSRVQKSNFFMDMMKCARYVTRSGYIDVCFFLFWIYADVVKVLITIRLPILCMCVCVCVCGCLLWWLHYWDEFVNLGWARSNLEVKFSGAFAKLRKVTIGFVMSVCPSVFMKQLGSHYTGFNEIWYLCIFLEICRENSSFIKIWQQ